MQYSTFVLARYFYQLEASWTRHWIWGVNWTQEEFVWCSSVRTVVWLFSLVSAIVFFPSIRFFALLSVSGSHKFSEKFQFQFKMWETLAVFILRAHYPSGRFMANIFSSYGYASRRTISWSASLKTNFEGSLFKRIMRLVPVFILETHNQTSYKCLLKLVQTDNASLVWNGAEHELHCRFHDSNKFCSYSRQQYPFI